jgi:enterobacterial common antigen flippase
MTPFAAFDWGSMTRSEFMLQRPQRHSIRTFIDHFGSTVLVQGLTLGIGVLTGALAARMLGPVGRGEYAAITIWTMAITNFLAFGINQAAVFYLGQRTFNASETATAISLIAFVQSALSILMCVAVVPFSLSKYPHSVRELGLTFAIFSPLLILSIYPANLFQGLQDMSRFNLIRLILPVTYAAGLTGLYVARAGTVRTVLISQILASAMSVLVGSLMVVRILRPRVQRNPTAIARLTHYGMRIQGLSIATFVNQRIDQLLLSLMVPSQQLGFYAVAVSLSTAMAVFPQAAGIVAFSKASSERGTDAKSTVSVAFRSSLIWLVLTCGALYVLAPLLIRHVFGTAFDGSILACRILLPGAVMTGLSFVLYNAASALGRPGLASYAEGASVIATAAGLYFLVPRYGYIGAAIVSSAAYTVSFLVMVTLAHCLLGLSLRFLIAGGQQNQTPAAAK